jgi:hypothetical protein
MNEKAPNDRGFFIRRGNYGSTWAISSGTDSWRLA